MGQKSNGRGCARHDTDDGRRPGRWWSSVASYGTRSKERIGAPLVDCDLLESSPSTGWRGVCAILDATTDIEPSVDALAAATRPDRSRRYRRKHVLGVNMTGGRNDTDDGRDGSINHAFEFLVDDDLEGFAIAASVDGDLKVMSFTKFDEAPDEDADHAVCRLPRNELLGKLLADFAVMYGRRPEAQADVAAHVAVDHLEIDDGTIDTLRQRIAAGGSDD